MTIGNVIFLLVILAGAYILRRQYQMLQVLMHREPETEEEPTRLSDLCGPSGSMPTPEDFGIDVEQESRVMQLERDPTRSHLDTLQAWTPGERTPTECLVQLNLSDYNNPVIRDRMRELCVVPAGLRQVIASVLDPEDEDDVVSFSQLLAAASSLTHALRPNMLEGAMGVDARVAFLQMVNWYDDVRVPPPFMSMPTLQQAIAEKLRYSACVRFWEARAQLQLAELLDQDDVDSDNWNFALEVRNRLQFLCVTLPQSDLSEALETTIEGLVDERTLADFEETFWGVARPTATEMMDAAAGTLLRAAGIVATDQPNRNGDVFAPEAIMNLYFANGPDRTVHTSVDPHTGQVTQFIPTDPTIVASGEGSFSSADFREPGAPHPAADPETSEPSVTINGEPISEEVLAAATGTPLTASDTTYDASAVLGPGFPVPAGTYLRIAANGGCRLVNDNAELIEYNHEALVAYMEQRGLPGHYAPAAPSTAGQSESADGLTYPEMEEEAAAEQQFYHAQLGIPHNPEEVRQQRVSRPEEDPTLLNHYRGYVNSNIPRGMLTTGSHENARETLVEALTWAHKANIDLPAYARSAFFDVISIVGLRVLLSGDWQTLTPRSIVEIVLEYATVLRSNVIDHRIQLRNGGIRADIDVKQFIRWHDHLLPPPVSWDSPHRLQIRVAVRARFSSAVDYLPDHWGADALPPLPTMDPVRPSVAADRQRRADEEAASQARLPQRRRRRINIRGSNQEDDSD